jgi:hypothetical protein
MGLHSLRIILIITTMDKQPCCLKEQHNNLEIVGLGASNNGHSCSVHSCCVDYLKVSDLMRLVKCLVLMKGELQEAIKCVHIIDGMNSCTATSVPRSMAKKLKIENELDSFVQVLELYDDSEWAHNRWKSHFNKEMVACIFIMSIPKAN